MYFKEVELLINWIKRDAEYIDLASYGLKNQKASFEILFKSKNTIISGIKLIKEVLKEFDIKSEFYFKDGQEINTDKNIRIATLTGDAYNLLICERTVLNTFSIMSGIATKTYEFSKKLKETGYNTKIAATRKTIPGIGFLQKIAVLDGGGDTHRWSLSESIMLKDNHLNLYGGIESAINEVKKYKSFTKKIEVEVETQEQAMKAIEFDADIIMLDNFSSEEAKKVAKKIKDKNNKIIVEVSGGIRKNTFLKYADNNIDIISTGILTTEIEYKDFSMEVIK
ncbi:nicotinate-nucleotide diphosphorylase [Tepiditoga spiralis]|uniref:nicotinate-nucleotide diphosphorylase (carboxylating) n=1 Tax=Tepiditoga spiralis TaxID=2108365 RepID=A0A7G1GAI5_9BACT|nr:carboxylating nicotinate-nucleotide diphosphorylase [Tepiditoga spiralis]BBE31162.1 nicotinate-nucleotide diphosphorylase [Tepiditoga spiralis]